MSIIEKKVYSDRFNIYFFNKNIFYQRETDSEIKRRFLWFKWTTPRIQDKKTTNESIRYYANSEKNSRKNVDDIIRAISEYDVISFDIFDTALYRIVDNPKDIFDLVGLQENIPDFKKKRIKAESLAREIKEKNTGSREVNISEIYAVLQDKLNVNLSQKVEEKIEIENIRTDKYVKKIYDFAIANGKTVIFTSDMYLAEPTIKQLLDKTGYQKFENIYLSNKYQKNKGIGDLFSIVKNDFPDKRIIHIGDNLIGDVQNPQKYGIASIHIPAITYKYKENNLDGISGSLYRSIVESKLNNGIDKFNLQYEHGYRVGGILCYGFCEYIDQIVKKNKIDKILFCARDCEIIHECYKKYFNSVQSKYLQVSRYALINAAPEQNIDDVIHRFILPNIRNNSKKLPISTILQESGYEILVPELDKYDIEKYAFPCNIKESLIVDFLYKNIKLIERYNSEQKKAAKIYFKDILENSERILIVDIGWSGTCITAFKNFIHKVIEKDCVISGLLMCTSRTEDLKNYVLNQEIDGYIYTPFKNVDLARFMMPSRVSKEEQEFLHMPLEYLFTSTDRSLIRYALDENGDPKFIRTNNSPTNVTEIKLMQKGILDFCEDFNEIYRKYPYNINSYVAFGPLKEAIAHRNYIFHVYRRFRYDALTVPYREESLPCLFGDLFEKKYTNNTKVKKNKKIILFVSPEMTYTGTPRSLLRMAKVAHELGFDPKVWTIRRGPFEKEFQNLGIEVREVSETDLLKREIIKEIQTAKMAICNTIVTNRYARICSKYIPTVWYIREATNIPDFIKNNIERQKDLEESNNIYCVSEYAAEAIAKFTNKKIRVIRNAVEDESSLVRVRKIKHTGDKVRFIQLGTIEYRKGYDVLIEAFLSLPKNYKEKVELYFAGGMINSGTPLATYIFHRMKQASNIHYLGVIDSIQKKIDEISKSDVVIVASRDESCSLVALEGAMLSKPLIVTENVGAKYIVNHSNGRIIKTGNVESLKKAIIEMVDTKNSLAEMGQVSRQNYEKKASMDFYKKQLESLYMSSEIRPNSSSLTNKLRSIFQKKSDFSNHDYIISLTSYPGRIKTVYLTIRSLLNQKIKAKSIVLYLSKLQFPQKIEGLPQTLIDLMRKNSNFEIRFVEDDLRPHKKYFYSIQEFKDFPVILVDDDTVYDSNLSKFLLESFRKWPNCVSCTRANLIMFNENGGIRSYSAWPMNYRALLDIPSYQLLATGVGGVLYPPKCLPDITFDSDSIKTQCIDGDDIWLKFMSVMNEMKTVCIKENLENKEIPDTQQTALWKQNVGANKNDLSIQNVLKTLKDKYSVDTDALLAKMFKDRFE